MKDDLVMMSALIMRRKLYSYILSQVLSLTRKADPMSHFNRAAPLSSEARAASIARRSTCNLFVQRIRLCLYYKQIWNENESEGDIGEMEVIVIKLTGGGNSFSSIRRIEMSSKLGEKREEDDG